MLEDPYFGLLRALAQDLPGIDLDPAALEHAQCLEIRGRRVDLSLECNGHDRAEDRIVLRCEVMHMPAGVAEALCRLLLQANNLWAGTRGATLGLLGDDRVVISVSARLRSLNAAQLAGLVVRLLRQAERWAAQLERTHHREPAPAGLPPDVRA